MTQALTDVVPPTTGSRSPEMDVGPSRTIVGA